MSNAANYLLLAIFCLVVVIAGLVVALFVAGTQVEIDHSPVLTEIEKSSGKIIAEIKAVHQRQDIHDKKQDGDHGHHTRFMIRLIARFGFLVDPKVEPPNFVPPKPDRQKPDPGKEDIH